MAKELTLKHLHEMSNFVGGEKSHHIDKPITEMGEIMAKLTSAQRDELRLATGEAEERLSLSREERNIWAMQYAQNNGWC